MADAAGAERAGPAEPNDGADLGEARCHLLLGIIICGLPQPMAERFMDEQGIASARELSMLSNEEVESAVKMHNQSIPTSRVCETQAWHRACQEEKGPQVPCRCVENAG